MSTGKEKEIKRFLEIANNEIKFKKDDFYNLSIDVEKAIELINNEKNLVSVWEVVEEEDSWISFKNNLINGVLTFNLCVEIDDDNGPRLIADYFIETKGSDFIIKKDIEKEGYFIEHNNLDDLGVRIWRLVDEKTKKQVFDIHYKIADNGAYLIISIGMNNGEANYLLRKTLKEFEKESYFRQIADFSEIDLWKATKMELEAIEAINDTAFSCEGANRYKGVLIICQSNGLISFMDEDDNNHIIMDDERNYTSELPGFINMIECGDESARDWMPENLQTSKQVEGYARKFILEGKFELSDNEDALYVSKDFTIKRAKEIIENNGKLELTNIEFDDGVVSFFIEGLYGLMNLYFDEESIRMINDGWGLEDDSEVKFIDNLVMKSFKYDGYEAIEDELKGFTKDNGELGVNWDLNKKEDQELITELCEIRKSIIQ